MSHSIYILLLYRSTSKVSAVLQQKKSTNIYIFYQRFFPEAFIDPIIWYVPLNITGMNDYAGKEEHWFSQYHIQ